MQHRVLVRIIAIRHCRLRELYAPTANGIVEHARLEFFDAPAVYVIDAGFGWAIIRHRHAKRVGFITASHHADDAGFQPLAYQFGLFVRREIVGIHH
ncbi:hypothetical protein D3C80_1515930 [compost metagenome]